MRTDFSNQNEVTAMKDPELGYIEITTSDEVTIERLRKKIRDLNAQVDDLGDLADDFRRDNRKQKAEINTLKADVRYLKGEDNKKTDMIKALENKFQKKIIDEVF